MLKKIVLFSITISIITSFNYFPLSIDNNKIVLSSLKEDKKEKVLIKCFYISNKYNVFDLTNMKYPSIKKGEYTEKLDNDYTLYFNFCGNTNKTCNNTKGQVIADNKEECILEAGVMDNGNQWEDLSNINASLSGVKITLNSGGICNQNETLKRTMKFIIQCDKNKDPYKNESRPYNITSKNYNPDNCENEIVFESYYACPSINLASIWAKIEEMKYISSIVLIISTTFLFVIIFAIMPSGGDRDIIFWVTVVVSIVLSGVISYFFWENTNLLLGIVSALIGGYLLGTFIYSLLLLKIKENLLINIVVIIVCMIIVFVITYLVYKDADGVEHTIYGDLVTATLTE